MNRNENTEETEIKGNRIGQGKKVKQRDQLRLDPGEVWNKTCT